MPWWRWDVVARGWQSLQDADCAAVLNGRVRLMPLGRGRRWALLSRPGPGTTVNGLPCVPLTVIDDRDEIGLGDERLCFSAQAPPEVVSAGHEAGQIRCARCRGPVEAGARLVRCPGCQATHHEACWTDDARCLKCAFPTDGTAWVPDPLD